MTTTCPCCGEMFIGEGAKTDPYNDGQVLHYCSWECVEHLQEEHQEYLDYCDM